MCRRHARLLPHGRRTRRPPRLYSLHRRSCHPVAAFQELPRAILHPSCPPANPKQDRIAFEETLMSDKIAFITGGNRGLGFQTALNLKGAAGVVIGARNLAQGNAAVEKLRQAGSEAEVIEFDVTNPAHHRAAYDYFASRYGRLDILVNNAGIAAASFAAPGPEHSAAQVPMEILRRVFETNFFSTVALTTTLLPLIRK